MSECIVPLNSFIAAQAVDKIEYTVSSSSSSVQITVDRKYDNFIMYNAERRNDDSLIIVVHIYNDTIFAICNCRTRLNNYFTYVSGSYFINRFSITDSEILIVSNNSTSTKYYFQGTYKCFGW